MDKTEKKTINKEDVKKLANLSRIEISEDEAEHLSKEIAGILGYVKQITETDVSGASDISFGPHNVMRDDVVKNPGGEQTERLLKSAPNSDGVYVKVKNIL